MHIPRNDGHGGPTVKIHVDRDTAFCPPTLVSVWVRFLSDSYPSSTDCNSDSLSFLNMITHTK